MAQRDRWLVCDGYTIELEDGHRIPLQDLHTMSGRQRRRLLRLTVWRLANRLAKPFPTSSFRCVDSGGELPVGPDAKANTRTAPATTSYRTDAALGHLAGEASTALVRPVPAARSDDSPQIAA